MSTAMPDGDRVAYLLARAADAALFGDIPADEERRTAAQLGIDLDHEIESLELVAAELAAEFAREAPAAPPPQLTARLHALADAMHGAPPAPIALPAARRPSLEKFAWAAAAASLTLAASSVWPVVRDRLRAEPAGTDFLGSHPRALRAAWTAPSNDHIVAPVAGEVRFDRATGEGELVIEGLAQNDPAREQYQLWIFDAARDERFPVDGGVFDITCAGRAVVQVRAKLPVDRPVLFAVTIERPGGAVVSERRVALMAKPPEQP